MNRTCKRGHEATIGEDCKACASFLAREWRKNNPEAAREKSRLNHEKHKDKEKELNRIWRAANSGYLRNWHLQNRYGLTADQFDGIMKAQNGVCAICKIKPASVVDHCHTTEKVRGLLCRTCNTGIGHLSDSIDLLKNAIEYLSMRKD